MLVVLASSCHFSTFLPEDAELLWGELNSPFLVALVYSNYV